MSYETTLLDSLFGVYRQRVLGLLLLQPDERFHVRELARQTETSAGTLHRELAKLAESGLLLRQRQGNQVLYQANQNSPVFEELAGLFRKTSGVVSVIRKALSVLAPQIRFALVFGSIAKGAETASSDIDVLVIGDINFAQIVHALYSSQQLLKREINPVVYSEDEFLRCVREGEAFIGEVLARPKLFLIGHENDFGKFAGHS